MLKEKARQCPMSFNNTGENGYQLCFDNCAWWDKEHKCCGIMTVVVAITRPKICVPAEKNENTKKIVEGR